MSGIERTDIDQQFDRLVRLVPKVNGTNTSGWTLIDGSVEGSRRTAWVIADDGDPLLTLGYTRRAALSSLAAMTSVLAVLLGA